MLVVLDMKEKTRIVPSGDSINAQRLRGRVPLKAGTGSTKTTEKLTAATNRKSGGASARHGTVRHGSPDRLGNFGWKNRKYGQQRAEVGVLESN